MGFFDFLRGGKALSLETFQPVMARLESQGVLMRLYRDEGRSEAWDLARREAAEAASRGKAPRGVCFCDGPSFVMLEEQGALAFNFGAAQRFPSYRETWSTQVEVGRQVVEALQQQGYSPQWPGTPDEVIVLPGVRWSGPTSRAGVTGPLLPTNRKPRAAPMPAVRSILVGGPVPGTLSHAFLAQLAALPGAKLFGPTDGSGSAAVDLDQSGVVLDFVAGPNDAERFPARYMLRTRDLLQECDVLLDPVLEAESPAGCWWSEWGVPRERRLRVVWRGKTPPTWDGSPAVALDDGLERVLAALRALPM